MLFAMFFARPGPAPFAQFVMFVARRIEPASRRDVRVCVYCPVSPGALPWPVIHDDHVISPSKANSAPAPGSEGAANRDARSEADCRPDREPGPRAHVDQ